MNSISVQLAVEKVGFHEILVVLVGKRDRQLTPDHPLARPLVDHVATESALNIALREIAEDVIAFQLELEDTSCASFDHSLAFTRLSPK